MSPMPSILTKRNLDVYAIVYFLGSTINVGVKEEKEKHLVEYQLSPNNPQRGGIRPNAYA